MSEDVTYRRFESADREPAFEVFRLSVWAYAQEIGLVGVDESDDLDAAWERQGKMVIHTEKTAAEDWLAEDESGSLLGWARTTVRDGHAQLTHFFVRPGQQGRGVGRSLLNRAFPMDLGIQRSILATQNPSALSLYLRYGVSVRGTSLDLEGSPQKRDLETDLDLQEIGQSSDAKNAILTLDEQILGYRRGIDLAFLLSDRPAYLFARNGEVVGYAFGSNGTYTGPAGALDPSDLPAILRHVEASALESDVETLRMTIPGAAGEAVRWALEAGYRIDPFFAMLLTSTPTMSLDRYVITQPSFTW